MKEAIAGEPETAEAREAREKRQRDMRPEAQGADYKTR
jgi:hypothetical protein